MSDRPLPICCVEASSELFDSFLTERSVNPHEDSEFIGKLSEDGGLLRDEESFALEFDKQRIDIICHRLTALTTAIMTHHQYGEAIEGFFQTSVVVDNSKPIFQQPFSHLLLAFVGIREYFPHDDPARCKVWTFRPHLCDHDRLFSQLMNWKGVTAGHESIGPN